MNDHSKIIEEAEAGVLWAYHLDGQGDGRRIDPSTALAATPSSGFNWVHIHSDSIAVTELMRTHEISAQVITALTASETRPRAIPLDGGSLITLRGVNTNPRSDPHDMISLRLWFSDRLIISARHSNRRLLSVEDVRQNIDHGIGPKTTGQAITMLTERIASRIADVVDDIEDDLSEIETNMSEIAVAEAHQILSESRRQAAAIRRYLAPQRIALDTLFRDSKLFSDREAHELQTQSDRITRFVEDLDLARERAMVLQGELQSRIAEEQNKRMYVLSIVAAIFLPLSFLTGLFGMNVAGLPGTEYPSAFIVLVIIMLSLVFALIAYMRWRKWL